MRNFLTHFLGHKVGAVRVVPLGLKIVAVFVIFLLISNFTTNYLNLILNRGEQIRLLNQLLVKDLKELHVFANNQREIFLFNPDEEAAVTSMAAAAQRNHRGERSLSLGVDPRGDIFFLAGTATKDGSFPDRRALNEMASALENGVEEGTLRFRYGDFSYFGVYKYNQAWGFFQIRAEELSEFYADSAEIFRNVSGIILFVTMIFAVIGILIIRHILRFVRVITDNIMKMHEDQALSLMELEGAPNDDVTYLGMAFNSLSNTIDNLMTIFKKFVARDVAAKAYEEREIRLEGVKRDLTILFTDIKNFTFMTEALGTDIIKLLNIHYDQAIHHIHEAGGDIGSIIGDALLAVFGTVEADSTPKSVQALQAAFAVNRVAASLRREMRKRRDQIMEERGFLTEEEQYVYRAVLLDVGVGLDGGMVFYGNIGSYERMVNTVIGDNVNSAARLEGLTRFYKVPLVCSEYVKDEVEAFTDQYAFVELDLVQVKGKTQGKKIFWPLEATSLDEEFRRGIAHFSEALNLYYQGAWPEAFSLFQASSLPVANIFKERIHGREAPEGWDGIWTMTEK
ncbi:Adenylate cyclase, class 3 [Alkalispirochaeta americana]|uniref:Adenylate cyclase, class 3 n=1 Tax=Alkalispirochaeta americana TaxID=159291 RepID=A0A1N6TXU1_9SPIO|nr:adenylate/guanylate cyclase domain-containing protein [Alkalispirochaeta americana]SIQ58144.1 Adenylate cyclase, class 3 [Alkalispirochaeta americana]